MAKEILNYANKLKEAGFSVYKNMDDRCDYFFIESKDGQIGYCQFDHGYSFSTVHKPNRKTGTGFSIHREVFSPTIKHAKDSLCFAPQWASLEDIRSVVKYRNFEEYMKRNTVLQYEQL